MKNYDEEQLIWVNYVVEVSVDANLGQKSIKTKKTLYVCVDWLAWRSVNATTVLYS